MGAVTVATSGAFPARRGPKQRWIFEQSHPNEAEALAKTARLPHVLAELLIARGIRDAAEAFRFLNPEAKHLHDPLLMLGMDSAVERVEHAIAAHEPILLYGDYDVDGATSSALLASFLRIAGCEPLIHIPDRIFEGYGPNTEAVRALAAKGATLLVTVDCVTTSVEPLAEREYHQLVQHGRISPHS